MLPPKRLESLLSQAVELQQERCTYHVKPGKLTLDDVSLLKDHACTKYVLRRVLPTTHIHLRDGTMALHSF